MNAAGKLSTYGLALVVMFAGAWAAHRDHNQPRGGGHR